MKTITSSMFVILIIFFFMDVTNAQVSNDSDLIRYWQFDGNTNDSSNNNHHASTSGAPTLTGGVFGQAYSFDGIDDIISVSEKA